MNLDLLLMISDKLVCKDHIGKFVLLMINDKFFFEKLINDKLICKDYIGKFVIRFS